MQTILISVDGVQPPTGNGFSIFAISFKLGGSWVVIDTGIDIIIPKNLKLEFEPEEGVFVGGYSFTGNRLKILVMSEYSYLFNSAMSQKKIATCWIVERTIKPIRFIEKCKEGRIIRGEPIQIENCIAN
jgi:hypothetical protein